MTNKTEELFEVTLDQITSFTVGNHIYRVVPGTMRQVNWALCEETDETLEVCSGYKWTDAETLDQSFLRADVTSISAVTALSSVAVDHVTADSSEG